METTGPNQADACTTAERPGSRDGQGYGDHDEPYTFGRRPSARAPFPFTPRQYAKLLLWRGRVADALAGIGDSGSVVLPRRPMPHHV